MRRNPARPQGQGRAGPPRLLRKARAAWQERIRPPGQAPECPVLFRNDPATPEIADRTIRHKTGHSERSNVGLNSVHQRLEAFVQDVAQSALDLRRHVEGATAWRERAMQLVTPKRARLADVIRTFLDHDPVSIALVMKRCGLGRTNARPHVMRLVDAGLIRTPGRSGRSRLYARA